MKKRSVLGLKKVTLRDLDEQKLQRIAGGDTDCSCCTCGGDTCVQTVCYDTCYPQGCPSVEYERYCLSDVGC
jgi:natural product precursor